MSNTTETILLNIQLNYSDSVKKSSELAKELEKLNAANKELKKSGFETGEIFIANARAIDALKAEQKDLTSTINQSIKATGAQVGSLNQLQAEVVTLRKQYYDLSEEQRKNEKIGGALIKSINEKNTALKAADALIGDNKRNVGNYSDALVDLKEKLREAQGEMLVLAQTVGKDSEEYRKAAVKAGELKDIISDIKEDTKAQSGDTAFEKLSATTGLLKEKLIGLDFKGVNEQVLQLSKISKETTFAEMGAGVGGLGNSLKALATTILTNPLFILAAVVGGIAVALKGLYDSMDAGNAVYEASAKEVANLRDSYNDLSQAIIQTSIDNDIAAGKISETRGAQLKNEAAFKKGYLDIQKQAAEAEAKIRETAEKEREQDGFKGTKNLLDKLGFETATTKAQRQSLEEIERQKNENITLLKKKFHVDNDAILIDEANKEKKIRTDAAEEAKRISQKQITEAKKLANELQELNRQIVEASKQNTDDIFKSFSDAYDSFFKRTEEEFIETEQLTSEYFTKLETERLNQLNNKQITQAEFDAQEIAAQELQLQTKLANEKAYGKSTAQTENEIAKQKAAIQKKSVDDQKKLEDVKNRMAMSAVQEGGKLLAAAASLASESKDIQKAAALAQVGINLGSALSSIVATANAPTPDNVASGGVTGFIKYATYFTEILTSIASAKSIISQAAGGGDFMTKGPTLLLVGDNPGGQERVTVEPISGRGQTRIAPNGNLVAMAGGGTITTTGYGGYAERNSSGLFDMLAMKEMMKQAFSEAPAPVLSLTELTKFNKKVTGTKDLSNFN